jgi:multiple sugar transport system ATP-binding protein
LLDPGKRSSGVEFTAPVDVTEWLGSELYAYIPFDTNPDVAGKLEELDRDLDGEGLRTQLIVALDSESRIRDGQQAALWFDPARAMIFDPESGENLTWSEDAARTIDAENEADRKASLERAHAREAATA